MPQSMVQDRMGATAPGRRGATTHDRTRPAARARRGAATHERRRGAGLAAKRVVLGVLTTLVSVNLWTGGPLLALWVGSRIQSAVGQLSMTAVGATVAVLIVETLVLYKALAYLNTRYNEAIGRAVPRRQAPWMKPMTGERRSLEVKRPLSATERIAVISVVAAVLALEIWFFFFAHYTLPNH